MIHPFGGYELNNDTTGDNMMNGARLVGRGLADTYDNLVYYTLISLMWWGCLATIVLAPAATLALFAHADPRIGTAKDRPAPSETIRYILQHIWRGWRLALITVPVLLLLTYNIAFYGTRTSAIGILAPFWFFLSVIGFMITVAAFSISVQLEEKRAFRVAKLAAILVAARLGHALLMIALTFVVALIAAVLVVPFIMFVPATVAAIFNRFVLTGLRIEIPDPLAPTPERAAEAQKRRKWFGP
jgi:uncharacterized membrane protein YesL